MPTMSGVHLPSGDSSLTSLTTGESSCCSHVPCTLTLCVTVHALIQSGSLQVSPYPEPARCSTVFVTDSKGVILYRWRRSGTVAVRKRRGSDNGKNRAHKNTNDPCGAVASPQPHPPSPTPVPWRGRIPQRRRVPLPHREKGISSSYVLGSKFLPSPLPHREKGISSFYVLCSRFLPSPLPHREHRFVA